MAEQVVQLLIKQILLKGFFYNQHEAYKNNLSPSSGKKGFGASHSIGRICLS